MKIPISPLQLKAHAFTAISVRVRPEGSTSNESNLIPTAEFVPDPELANHWRLALGIKVGGVKSEKPFIYEIEVAVQGLVEVDKSFPATKREHLAAVNGLGLLYSSIREMVTNLTARSAHGTLNLPTLNFVEIITKTGKFNNVEGVGRSTMSPARKS